MKTTGTPCLRWQLEHTDTFGGEANYSWLNRENVMIPSKYSVPWIVRKAKEAMGLTQLDHVTSDYGDTIRVDFRQDNQVLFITLEDECRYCGGNCPNDHDHACDGYLGDIDNLYYTHSSSSPG